MKADPEKARKAARAIVRDFGVKGAPVPVERIIKVGEFDVPVVCDGTSWKIGANDNCPNVYNLSQNPAACQPVATLIAGSNGGGTAAVTDP